MWYQQNWVWRLTFGPNRQVFVSVEDRDITCQASDPLHSGKKTVLKQHPLGTTLENGTLFAMWHYFLPPASAVEVIESVPCFRLSVSLSFRLSVCAWRHYVLWHHKMMSVGRKDYKMHVAGGASTLGRFHSLIIMFTMKIVTVPLSLCNV